MKAVTCLWMKIIEFTKMLRFCLGESTLDFCQLVDSDYCIKVIVCVKKCHIALYTMRKNADFEPRMTTTITTTATKKDKCGRLVLFVKGPETPWKCWWPHLVHDLKRSSLCRYPHTLPSPKQMSLPQEKLCLTPYINPSYLLPDWFLIKMNPI